MTSDPSDVDAMTPADEAKAETCLHLRQFAIPTARGWGGWCFRCGALNVTDSWMEPDFGGNGKPAHNATNQATVARAERAPEKYITTSAGYVEGRGFHSAREYNPEYVKWAEAALADHLSHATNLETERISQIKGLEVALADAKSQYAELEALCLARYEDLETANNRLADLLRYHGCDCDSEVGHDDYCVNTMFDRAEMAEARLATVEGALAEAVKALQAIASGELHNHHRVIPMNACYCDEDHATAALAAIKQPPASPEPEALT